LKLNFNFLFVHKSYLGIGNFWILFFLSNLFLLPAYSQLILIQNEFEKFGFITPKFIHFVTIDTMNQMQINGITRLAMQDLSINGIELFSKFDGGYALQFLPVFFSCDTNQICHLNSINKPKDEYLTKASLFTGNKNGFFQAYHRGRHRSFYWLIHPYLEINNGIYYSDKQHKVFEQKIVENSSFQNISGRVEFGIRNDYSYLLFDSYLSFANLYKPLNLMDSSKIKHKFGDYNNFLAQIKFSNTFSDFIKISGNIFLKNFLRNHSTVIDSNIFSFDIYNSDFEIEEFNYGINTKIDYDSKLAKNPTQFKLIYSQDLFLVNSNYLKSRSRTEAENLQIGLEQLFEYSNNGRLTIELISKSRAMLYSSLDKLPKNNSFLNLSIRNIYNFDSTIELKSSFSRIGIMPFVIYYYKIFDTYQSNLDIQPEIWYTFENEFKLKINERFNIVPSINIFYGQNVFLLDQFNKQYKANGTSKGFQLGISGKYYYNSVSLKFNGNYNYQVVSDDFLLFSNFLRMPRYNLDINFYHYFYEFLELELNIKIQDGLFSLNPTTKTISRLPSKYSVNLMLQKQYDNAFFTLIFRNLTNNYSESNFGIPDRGLGFLLGTGINF